MRRLRVSHVGTGIGLLLLGILLLGAQPVQAHAVLTLAEPGPNQILSGAPLRVRLHLSEDLDASFSVLRVSNTAGASVIDGASRVEADGRTLVADLTVLHDGVYTVRWRALSLADGHVTEGTYGFGVGNVSGAIAPPSGTTISGVRSGGALTIGLRGLIYVGVALVIGPALFLSVPWRFALTDPAGGLKVISDRSLRGRLRSMAPWQELDALVLGQPPSTVDRHLPLPPSLQAHARWVVFSLAALGASVGATATILFATVSAQLVGSDLVVFLSDSRSGNLLSLTAMGLLMSALAAVVYARRPHQGGHHAPLVIAAPAGVALLGLALHSHAAGADPRWGPLVALVHLTVVSSWSGSLCALVALTWALRRAAAMRQKAIVSAAMLAATARYATLAAVLAGSTVLTGVVLLMLVLGPIPTLLAILLDPLGTLYLLLLDAKLVLVCVLLALGALHHLVMLPALAQDAVAIPATAPRHARRAPRQGIDRTVALEAVGAVVLLLLVGALVQQSPTTSNVDSTPQSRTLILMAAADELDVELRINPANPIIPGFQSFTITVTDDGAPFTGIRAVDLEFLGPGSIVAELNRTTPDGVGHFATSGGFLRTTGEWLLTVKVRRTDSADTFAAFVVTVVPPPVSEVPIYQGLALSFEKPSKVSAESSQPLTFTLRDALSGARIAQRRVDIFISSAPTGLIGTPEAFESPTILPGESWTLKVTQPISATPVRFHDHLHPIFNGSFLVDGAGLGLVDLTVDDDGFSPSNATVAPGGSIVVTNRGVTPHAMNFGTGHIDDYTVVPFTAREVAPGRYTGSVTFPTEGRYIIQVRVDNFRGIFFFLQEVGAPTSTLPAGDGPIALVGQYGLLLVGVLVGAVLLRARFARTRQRKRVARAVGRKPSRR